MGHRFLLFHVSVVIRDVITEMLHKKKRHGAA